MKHNLKLILLGILLLNNNLQARQPEEVYANGSYSVTYVTYGGTNAPSNPTTYSSTGTDVTLLPATKPNLVFSGWYASPLFEMDEKVTELPGDFAGVTKLYARWSPDHPILSFEENGGALVDDAVLQPKAPFASEFPTEASNLTIDMSHGYKSLSADFNEDGYGDTLFLPYGTNFRVIVWGSSTGTLTTTEYPITSNIASWDAEYVDADGDGFKDIIIINSYMTMSTPPVVWLKGTGVGTFAPEAPLPTLTVDNFPNYLMHIDHGDINEDGILDFVYQSANQVGHILGLGDGTFGAYTPIEFTNASAYNNSSSYARHILLEDMNNDGTEDLIFHDDSNMFIAKKTAGQPFGGTVYNFGNLTYNGFAADLNQDGSKEYIVKGDGNSQLYQFVFNQDLTSAVRNDLGTVGGFFWGNVFNMDAMDVNGDGILDPSYVTTGNSYSWLLVSRKLSNGTFVYDGNRMFGNFYYGSILYNPIDGSFGISGFDFIGKMVRHHYSTKNYTDAITDLRFTSTTKLGYTFQGWYIDAELVTTFNWGANLTQDTTIYAKWSLNQYNISYVLNGGTNSPNNPLLTNILSPAYTLENPTKANSRFDGWFEYSSFEGEPVTDIPASNMNYLTFYAKWTDAKAITFVMNGGPSVPAIYALPGVAVSAPADPVRAGYVFEGWFTSNAFTELFVFSTMPETGASAFAKWRALPFTLSFVSNGAEAIDSLIFNTDANIVFPPNPTKVGHTFAGWHADSGLTTLFTAKKMLPRDVTLYAKWIVNVHQFTFTVDDETTTLDVDYGTLLSTLLPTPTRYQYEFLGWSIDGETIVNLSTFTMPDNDVTFVALFRDNVTPTVFTLTDGDTYEGSVEIIFNEGTATLNGEEITSGFEVTEVGEYELIVEDEAGNRRTVRFTVIEAVDHSQTIMFYFYLALAFGLTFIFVLAILPKGKRRKGPPGATPPPTIKPTPVKEVAREVKVEKETPKKVEPKKTVMSILEKDVSSETIEQTFKEESIFKTPIKLTKDPLDEYPDNLKEEFKTLFVDDKRPLKIEELTYTPNTVNEPFYRHLFKYIYQFRTFISSSLLVELSSSVSAMKKDDKEAQLKIIEVTSRTLETQKDGKTYLLKALRKNVALHRDVINPRNIYVYSYQRLATLLEELEIYVEAVVLVREAYERGLIDTPEPTFTKRLERLEKKLIQSNAGRQDVIKRSTK